MIADILGKPWDLGFENDCRATVEQKDICQQFNHVSRDMLKLQHQQRHKLEPNTAPSVSTTFDSPNTTIAQRRQSSSTDGPKTRLRLEPQVSSFYFILLD
jgi:hypothetical protein